MSTRRSTNRRSRNLSRSTLRLDIARAPLFVSLREHLARRIDDGVNAAGEFDRPGDIHVQGRARVVLAADAGRPRRAHDLLAQHVDCPSSSAAGTTSLTMPASCARTGLITAVD